VHAALDAFRADGGGFVVVLGEPAYYGRFGFEAAASYGLHDEYGGGSAFQVVELRRGAIPRGAGRVRYAPEFAAIIGSTSTKPPKEQAFTIDDQLLTDCHRLGRLGATHLLLHKNSLLPWFILVPETAQT